MSYSKNVWQGESSVQFCQTKAIQTSHAGAVVCYIAIRFYTNSPNFFSLKRFIKSILPNIIAIKYSFYAVYNVLMSGIESCKDNRVYSSPYFICTV